MCELDGTCRPLPSSAESSGFLRAHHLEALDWASVRRDQRRSVEAFYSEVLLGGEVRGELAFAFRLKGGAVRRATLQLAPASSFHGGMRQTLVAFRVAPFRGERVSWALPPRRVGAPGTERTLTPAGRPIRLDVTSLVREARADALHRGEADPVVYLGVAVTESAGVPWRIASPGSVDRTLRPRLELRTSS